MTAYDDQFDPRIEQKDAMPTAQRAFSVDERPTVEELIGWSLAALAHRRAECDDLIDWLNRRCGGPGQWAPARSDGTWRIVLADARETARCATLRGALEAAVRMLTA